MKRSLLIVTGSLFVSFFLAVGLVVCAQEQMAIFNSGFEILPPGVTPAEALGKTPYGWSASTSTPDTATAVLSDEQAFEGRYSLKVTTGEAGKILTCGQPVAIEGGKTYAAMWRIYNARSLSNQSNNLVAYIEFWGAAGGWWGKTDFWSQESWEVQKPGGWSTSKRLEAVWTHSRQFDQWEDVLVIAEAPANATHATLALWVPGRSLISYADDVQFGLIDE
jgi:hypothetical protein